MSENKNLNLFKNLTTLASGTSLAQLIPILISPILTRLYDPTEFGIFAFFVSCSMIIGVVANGKYDLAILLPVKIKATVHLLLLSILVTSTVGIIFEIIVLLYSDELLALASVDLGFHIYLIPLAIIFISNFNTLNQFHTRQTNYSTLSVWQVIKAIAVGLISIGCGLLGFGAAGLILGFITGYAILNIGLSIPLIKIINHVKLSTTQLKYVLKRYKDFPKFQVWAVLANTLTWDLTTIIIGYIYSAEILGFYSLSFRMLMIPSNFIGAALRQVLYQDFAAKKKEKINILYHFDNISKKLFLLALIVFSIVYFVIEDIFSIVFGEQWVTSGEFGKILIPLILARFIVAPMSVILNVFEKQKLTLALQIGMFLTCAIDFLLTYIFSFEIEVFLHIFVASLLLYHLIFFIVVRYVITGKSQ